MTLKDYLENNKNNQYEIFKSFEQIAKELPKYKKEILKEFWGEVHKKIEDKYRGSEQEFNWECKKIVLQDQRPSKRHKPAFELSCGKEQESFRFIAKYDDLDHKKMIIGLYLETTTSHQEALRSFWDKKGKRPNHLKEKSNTWHSAEYFVFEGQNTKELPLYELLTKHGVGPAVDAFVDQFAEIVEQYKEACEEFIKRNHTA